MEVYDEVYFERGVEAHVSGYTDYKWKPEYVLPMANWLKQKFNKPMQVISTREGVHFKYTTFLDYGCAKGFLVKALKLLGCKAIGYDISIYAISHCEPEVLSDLFLIPQPADVVIMKDVLEHISEEDIPSVLLELETNFVVAIIPLGDEGKFRIREYELDVTHVTKKDEVWWIQRFNEAGFELEEFYYSIPGIKDNWTSKYPYGNGVFIFKRRY